MFSSTRLAEWLLGPSRWGRCGAGALWSALVLATVVVASGGCTGASTRSSAATAPGTWPPDTARAARLVFVGDTGTGDDRARSVAAMIRRQSEVVPVSHVFLLGDNVYEHGHARSISNRFLDVYEGVSSLGVRIHAALGNHDVEHCGDSGLRPVPRDESAYRLSSGCDVQFHLTTPEFGYRNGLRYYSIEIPAQLPGWRRDGGAGRDPTAEGPPLVEVFVLDSNTLSGSDQKLETGSDEPQLRWLAGALQRSRASWKVVAMHHPIYSPKRCMWFRFRCRDEDEVLRAELEPIFREYGVDIVFQAHQHLYARLLPQHGIRYFVTGGGGRETDAFRKDERTVPRNDRGSFNHFVYVHVTEDRFGYCVIDADGDIRDGGSFGRDGAVVEQVNPCPPPEDADAG
ncbi:MAG: hypothetical protein F4X60_09920 [Gemmatimonadetes bacterium]|nr:hypothetical protein [Gemmatimonadota bacterium]